MLLLLSQHKSHVGIVYIIVGTWRNGVLIRGKRVAIPVHFIAPSGGLHENVKDTVRYLRGHDVKVSVFSPPGPFGQEIADLGADWFEMDERGYTAAEFGAGLPQFDLVHAHPGLARKLGLRIADASRCPFLITFHGAWLNNVETYSAKCTYIIAVSDAIAEATRKVAPEAADRVFVIRNGSNFDTNVQLQHAVGSKEGATLDICVASRFDVDKIVLVEFLERVWRLQGQKTNANFRWHVAGTGTEQSRLISAAEYLNAKVRRAAVTFYGWLGKTDLDALYGNSDLAMAPGRSAIDAMARGLPVIAIGSKGCAGLVTNDNFALLSRSNFGGFGLADVRSPQDVIETLTKLVCDRHELSKHAHGVYLLARDDFGAERQNRILGGLYEEALRGHRRMPQ